MLQITRLKKSFDALPVIDGLSLSVKDGEIVGVIGPSGCGKSTLLNLISRLNAYDSGSIQMKGRGIGYIFQDDRLLPWRTVYDNIRLVRDREDRDEISRLMRIVELEDFADYYPEQLSGGMRKRCGIARAFYSESRLLLLDEPFQALDIRLRAEMHKLLRTIWQKSRQAMLFVTHDVDEVIAVSHRVIVLSSRPARIICEFTTLGDTNGIRQEIVGILQKEEPGKEADLWSALKTS